MLAVGVWGTIWPMSRESRRLVWALRALALLLVGLTLAAPLFPEEVAWGLWPAVYVSAGWRWALAGLTVGLVLCGDCSAIGRRAAVAVGAWRVRRQRRAQQRSSRQQAHALRFGIALAMLAPFYLFRLRHLRWGDAYILVHAIPHPEVRLTYNWQAPLDVFIHAKAWALGHQLFGWPDAMPVYWLLSTLAGGVFVWVLLGLADWLGRDRVEQWMIAGLVLSLGLMQLFFGYVENYSLMTVGVLVYIWLALRAQRGEIALVWPATALALTHAFHPSTIVLAPSLLYLAWQMRSVRPERTEAMAVAGRSSRPSPGRRIFWQVVGPYALVFAGVVALMTAGNHGLAALFGADAPGGGDRRWFVPLFETSTRWEHYTMFSPGHLLDIINEQLLVAPTIWPTLALTALFARRRVPWRDPMLRLLLIMALLYLVLTLTWNPDYGGQRDWDLFAPASLPAALLAGVALARGLPERPALAAAGRALIAVQAFRLALWIYQNTLPWTPT